MSTLTAHLEIVPISHKSESYRLIVAGKIDWRTRAAPLSAVRRREAMERMRAYARAAGYRVVDEAGNVIVAPERALAAGHH